MTGGRGAGPGAVAFSTHGGPGSIYAEAEEMRVVAGRHEHAADEAAGASWQVDAAAFGLGRSAAWLASAALLQDRLAEAVGRVRSLSEQCAELHRDLLSAAARYEEAERAAAGITAAEDASLEELPALLWRDGHDGLTTREAERLVQDLVQAVPEAIVAALLTAAGFPLLAALARIDVKMLTRAQKRVLKRPVSSAAKKGTDAASDLTEALRVSPDEAWTAVADALTLAGAAPRGAAPARVRASATAVHASSGETRSASVRSDAASVPFFAAEETGRFSTRFCALVSIFTSIRARAASRGKPAAVSRAATMASGTAWTRSCTSRSASRVVRPSWPSRQSSAGSSSREASSAAVMPAAARSASS